MARAATGADTLADASGSGSGSGSPGSAHAKALAMPPLILLAWLNVCRCRITVNAWGVFCPLTDPFHLRLPRPAASRASARSTLSSPPAAKSAVATPLVLSGSVAVWQCGQGWIGADTIPLTQLSPPAASSSSSPRPRRPPTAAPVSVSCVVSCVCGREVPAQSPPPALSLSQQRNATHRTSRPL
jgi:hypothetical protein